MSVFVTAAVPKEGETAEHNPPVGRRSRLAPFEPIETGRA